MEKDELEQNHKTKMTSKKGKKEPKKPAKEHPEPKKPEERAEAEKPFDFGGLPQRDLKKNLGCG